jgi:Flp pilus assembly pilin Flp
LAWAEIVRLGGLISRHIGKDAVDTFWQEIQMNEFLQTLRRDQQGQDIAEYAVMLAVILVLVVGTIRLVGSNANNVFSSVASAVH